MGGINRGLLGWSTLFLALFSFGASADSDLVGTWSTACKDGAATSLAIEDTSLWVTYVKRAQSDCSGPEIERYDSQFIYETDELGNIDFTLVQVTNTVFTLRDVDIYIEKSQCGSHDWKRDEPMEITGKDCGGWRVAKGGQISHNMFAEEGDVLKFAWGQNFYSGYFGTAEAADRPTKVEGENVTAFTRVD